MRHSQRAKTLKGAFTIDHQKPKLLSAGALQANTLSFAGSC
jgi:hypothetical protein